MEFSYRRRKCRFCFSLGFTGLLSEPISDAIIEVPVITHSTWLTLTEKEQIECIENELRIKGVF
jgi:hypothetical protein